MTSAAERTLRVARWADAINEAEAGDAALLATLLRSDWPIPGAARLWLSEHAYLLARRPRGRPPVLGAALLKLEQRHYAGMVSPGAKTAYAAALADEYGIKFEAMQQMLSRRSAPEDEDEAPA